MVGHDGHRGWLYYVASTPESRGSGIGRQMVSAAEEWLMTTRRGESSVAGKGDEYEGGCVL